MRVSHVLFVALACASLAHAAEDLAETGLSLEDFHASDPQLAEWIGVLLAENPEVLAARATALADRGRGAQERSLPDPTQGVGVIGLPGCNG